jgi:hypothetical protein
MNNITLGNIIMQLRIKCIAILFPLIYSIKAPGKVRLQTAHNKFCLQVSCKSSLFNATHEQETNV